MASHLSAIGYQGATSEAFGTVIVRAANQGAPVQGATAGHGYRRWAPGGGIELWVQLRGKEIVGFNPHFAGKGRITLGVGEAWPDPEYPLDGRVQGWVNPPADDPGTGEYPLVCDVPDFDAIRSSLRPRTVLTVQVAAFAHEIACFEDDQAFSESQEQELKFAPESFLPAGMLEVPLGARPEATAIFAGHVEECATLVNPETGQSFLWMLVKILGGSVDVVADPSSVKGAPRVGGVVEGHFWLSGRVQPQRSSRGIMPIPIR